MAQTNSSLSSESEMLNQVLGLIEAFRAFDSDNDGFITIPELGGILGSLGYKASEQDVNAMMHEGDKDRDGLLSLAEFLEMNTKTMKVAADGILSSLKTAFEALDFDDEDSVMAEDLFETIENVGIQGISFQDCERIVGSMDGDGDGAVNILDFKLIISSLL